MAQVFEHLGKDQRIVDYADQRINEIEENIELLKDEKRMWQDIQKLLRPCRVCGGYGSITERIAMDESRSHTCKACGGSGKVRRKLAG